MKCSPFTEEMIMGMLKEHEAEKDDILFVEGDAVDVEIVDYH